MTNILHKVKWQNAYIIDDRLNPFQCNKCGERFKFAKRLRNHIREIHAY